MRYKELTDDGERAVSRWAITADRLSCNRDVERSVVSSGWVRGRHTEHNLVNRMTRVAIAPMHWYKCL